VARLQHAYQGRRPRSPIAGPLHGLLLALFWIALTLALMQPRWLEPHTEVRTEGYDLMLAVDTSRSMTALDFSHDNRPVSRMAVVKGVMDRFIENRKGDRVGLVIFGNQAFVQSPLTFDLDAVRRILADIDAGHGRRRHRHGRRPGPRREEAAGAPAGLPGAAAGHRRREHRRADPAPCRRPPWPAREGVRIYSIGVGSNQAEVLIQGSDGQYRNESDIGLDEETLKRIARATGGEYYRATDTHALEAIYQKIDTLEKTEAETRTTLIPHPLFRWPLGAALFFLFLLGLFPEGRMRIPGGRNHA
jgi:Ca-activated chloride channel homolog